MQRSSRLTRAKRSTSKASIRKNASNAFTSTSSGAAYSSLSVASSSPSRGALSRSTSTTTVSRSVVTSKKASHSGVMARKSQVRSFSSSSPTNAVGGSAVNKKIDASQMEVTKTTTPKEKVPFEQLKFGHTFTDHMLEVDYSPEEGWGKPRIVPHGPLAIDPAASSLHYGLQCFEGMKAYIDSNNDIRIFRPEMNFRRMNSSANRLLLPNIDEQGALDCLKQFLKMEKEWIPNKDGYSLYLRPTLISTTPFLGVAPPTHAKFFIIASPVGPYYPTGFAPVKLLADPQYVRAWPGGTGHIKCGGNYALTIAPGLEAAKKGYQQLLWLFGKERYVTEVGTMNQFWYWVNESGDKELVTAPLDGTILPGVTRDSVIQLAKSWGIKVREEQYTIDDVISAIKEGRMIEAFGSGTAAIVSPVKAIGYEGVDYNIPLHPTDPKGTAGVLTQKVADTIMGIQYGKIPHEWSHVVL